MATFDLDPAVRLSQRLASYADALDAEGQGDRAEEVRRAARVYRALMEHGEAMEAIEIVGALGLLEEAPLFPRQGDRAHSRQAER